MRVGSCTKLNLALATAMMVLSVPRSGYAAPDIVSLWGGARGTIVLKSDGTVWTWGGGGFGKLGINTTNGRALVPVEVHGANDIGCPLICYSYWTLI